MESVGIVITHYLGYDGDNSILGPGNNYYILFLEVICKFCLFLTRTQGGTSALLWPSTLAH